MVEIDERLLDCASTPELIENFNRILALLDAQEERIQALETPEEET